MGKVFKFVTAAVLVLVIVMATVPFTAEAKQPAATAGRWTYTAPDYLQGGVYVKVTGKEVDVNSAAATAPSWLELKSYGLELSAGAKICHPFPYGQDGWVAQIMKLNGTTWTKLTTKAQMGADTVTYEACAQATEAGTYALFSYYKDLTQVTPVADTTLGTGVGSWQLIAKDILVGGKWTKVTGKEVEVDLAKYPAPTYRALLSKGIMTSSGAKICHPFRLGQFNWVGEIYQLKDGKWVKMTTTNAMSPTKYMSCAQVADAGTYALFGLYKPAK